ncbi:MAG: hypothetical protein NUV80_04635 [Candidatus Berkelbacteria bacterium]|nr:hypothetical protein [Candidatus Berkelbacteria bacterium]
MPDNNNDNGGANGDGAAAAAAAQAAADAAAAAAAAGAGNGDGANGEETITIKKSELEQIKTDRDNYKKIGLQKKADERDLHNAGAGAGSGDGKGGEGDGKGGAVIDEKKISDTATAATTKVLRDASEKTAKRSFLKAHPEYLDDSQWTGLMSHLTFKGGEVTQDEVVDRMEAALFEHKRSTGKLDEHLKSEHERGVREGRIQAEVGSGHGTGGAGDRNDGGKGVGSLSPKGEEMARSMHTDPLKAAKVDPSKDNVIDITKV